MVTGLTFYPHIYIHLILPALPTFSPSHLSAPVSLATPTPPPPLTILVVLVSVTKTVVVCTTVCITTTVVVTSVVKSVRLSNSNCNVTVVVGKLATTITVFSVLVATPSRFGRGRRYRAIEEDVRIVVVVSVDVKEREVVDVRSSTANTAGWGGTWNVSISPIRRGGKNRGGLVMPILTPTYEATLIPVLVTVERTASQLSLEVAQVIVPLNAAGRQS